MCRVIAFHTVQPFKIDYRPCKRLCWEAYRRDDGCWGRKIARQRHATVCVSVNNVADSPLILGGWAFTRWRLIPCSRLTISQYPATSESYLFRTLMWNFCFAILYMNISLCSSPSGFLSSTHVSRPLPVAPYIHQSIPLHSRLYFVRTGTCFSQSALNGWLSRCEDNNGGLERH